MFGVVFPNQSFPIDISTFTQIDTFHWLLDMNTFVSKISITHISHQQPLNRPLAAMAGARRRRS
ncbi:putative OPI10 family protein [Helianthus debilis subsp. tardiflorus]